MLGLYLQSVEFSLRLYCMPHTSYCVMILPTDRSGALRTIGLLNRYFAVADTQWVAVLTDITMACFAKLPSHSLVPTPSNAGEGDGIRGATL
jgi:hypothetical protein